MHPNIAVFRHPDHLPDRQELTASITSSLQNMSLDAKSLAKMSGDTIKGIYGMNNDVILYWAHHEKLCLIDGRTAFMGGLDLCFGRWDTNQHALSDVHGENLNEIIFPGQDYNNARVLDFTDVAHWEQNPLDRKKASRMGWSDISVSLHGPVTEDLRRHFIERWNFIYDSKYQARQDSRYSKLVLYGRPGSSTSQQHGPSKPGGPQQHSPQQGQQQGAHQQYSPSQQQGSQPPSTQAPSWQQTSHSTSTQAPGSQTPSWQQGSQPTSTQSPGSQMPSWQQGGHSTTTQAPTSQAPSWQQGSQSTPTQPSNTQTPTWQQSPATNSPTAGSQQYTYTGQSFPPPPPGPPPSQSQTQSPAQSQGQTPYFPPPPTQGQGSHSQTRGLENEYEGTRGHGDTDRGFVPRRFREDITQYGNVLRGQLAGQIHQYQDRLTTTLAPGQAPPRGPMNCQIVRSSAKWSNGTTKEHSIQDAYAAIIKNSEHFVYIENQFFITATGDSQKPVQNKIGAAIVERILRAARAGEKYKVIVVIPSVPCFAGDLGDDSTLGTRAIMEFQYNSINRGGNSIMELIAKEGFNPMEYIRFYNLRNYDRINATGPMTAAEQRSGVNYEEARKEHDVVTGGPGGYGPGAPRAAFDTTAPFQKYQQAAHQVSTPKSGRWNSVSECYMLNGQDIRNVPWDGPAEAEIDAFVTEELYVHSKVKSSPFVYAYQYFSQTTNTLIGDDR